MYTVSVIDVTVCHYTVCVTDVTVYHYTVCVIAVTVSLGQHAFSRAYINLINHQDIAVFVEKFDGYVFVDSRGDVTFVSFNNIVLLCIQIVN